MVKPPPCHRVETIPSPEVGREQVRPGGCLHVITTVGLLPPQMIARCFNMFETIYAFYTLTADLDRFG